MAEYTANVRMLYTILAGGPVALRHMANISPCQGQPSGPNPDMTRPRAARARAQRHARAKRVGWGTARSVGEAM